MIQFILAIFIFSTNCFADQTFFASKKIDFTFTDHTTASLLPKLNGANFRGVINIRDPKYSNQNIYYYNFDKDNEIKVSDEYCQKKIEQLYGPKNDRSIKLDSLNIQNSTHGSICSIVILMDSEIMTIKKRYMMIGFIKARSVLLEWTYTNANADIPKDKLLDFWNSLK